MSERLIATLGRAGEPEFAVFVAQWIPVEAVRSRILNSLLFQHAFPVEGAGYERLTQLWKVVSYRDFFLRGVSQLIVNLYYLPQVI